MKKPHKHKELINAWADGAEIEVRAYGFEPWADVPNPTWNTGAVYRIKPEQEPFGYFKSEPFGWTDCAKADEGAIALYERPAPEQEREACMELAGEFARKWWSIHCASNKHMETTRKAHDDFCALQAMIRARGKISPPKREWVDLTLEQYEAIWRMDLNHKDLMDRTIAKLKELNHDNKN